jgi:hypothetical protein
MPLTTFTYEVEKGRPRPAKTYRGARRNAARGTTWRGVKPTGRIYQPPVYENSRFRRPVVEGRVLQ